MNKVREQIKAELSKHCDNQGGSLSGNLNFSLNDLTLCETIVWLGKDIISWQTGGGYGQERAFIFGSFRLKWGASEIICELGNKATAEINFQASDVLHLQSALRVPLTNIGPDDEPFGRGKPLHNVPIDWSWSEKVTF